MTAPNPPPGDGWTFVSKNKGRGKARHDPPLLVNGLPAVSKDLTLAQVTKDFNAKLKAWRASTCYSQLQQILTRLQPEQGWQINKAVILASGSLSRDNLECRRRSMWQLVVFVDLIRQLADDSETAIEAFAQEPAFTDLDREFLQSMGIAELPVQSSSSSETGSADAAGLGPAKEHCGPQSLVFEPFMDMDLSALRDLADAQVALYLGSTMPGRIERSRLTATATSPHDASRAPRNPTYTAATAVDKAQRERLATIAAENELARHFQAQYRMYRFPAFDCDPNVLEGIGIFAKTDEEE